MKTYTPVGNGNIDCCECGEVFSAHKDGACPAALASLAPAAVERDAATEAYSVYYMHVNNRTKPREAMRLALAAAFPALTAQVAALTAQCESHKADAEYRLWKLQQVIPVMQEARDALCALTTAQIKLHHISPTLADRMDTAGTADVEQWQAAIAAGNGEGV